jgi:hypothetical protein
MEEWQRRIKAEKEAERKKKSESAEILHGYQGGVSEEELKLRALREEERKKLQDAQENLRAYKAKEVEGVRSPRGKRQQVDYPTPVNVGGEYEDPLAAIAKGSVSEKAAKLKGHGSEGVELRGRSAYSAAAGQPADASVQPNGEAAFVETSAVEVPPLIGTEQSTEEKELDQHPPAAAGNEPLRNHPTVVRLDVLFSFGLVTAEAQPLLNLYMQAVEEIVRNCLAGDTTLAHFVSYNPEFTPFVKDTAWDDAFTSASGRTDAKRMLVTAAVPVFLRNGISVVKARDAIVAYLQRAVASGDFLTLARGY